MIFETFLIIPWLVNFNHSNLAARNFRLSPRYSVGTQKRIWRKVGNKSDYVLSLRSFWYHREMWPGRDPFQLDDRDGWKVTSHFSRDVFFQGIKQQTNDPYLSPSVKYILPLPQ